MQSTYKSVRDLFLTGRILTTAMEKMLVWLLILMITGCCPVLVRGRALGACYGRHGNNLPRPEKVARFAKSIGIKNVRIYDSNVDVIRAFSNTDIELILGIPNVDLHGFSTCEGKAGSWVTNHILPYYPSTKITHIIVGEEVTESPLNVTSLVVPAMRNVHTALRREGLDSKIKVSSSHSLRILSNSYPPSAGTFNSSYDFFLKPMLEFLNRTQSPFMVDVYPYYAYVQSPGDVPLDYALFNPKSGVTDYNTGLFYSNLFDAQIDAVYSALAALNFSTMSLTVSETGWPTKGNAKDNVATLKNAAIYTTNLVSHVLNNTGSPLRPYQEIDTYMFSLFNENLKPGAESERHFGIFYPNETKVVDVNITWRGSTHVDSIPNTTDPGINIDDPKTNRTFFDGTTWCVASQFAKEKDLLKSLDWICGLGNADCLAIKPGQSCYQPNNLLSHTSYAFNSYYQQNRHTPGSCSFGGIAILTSTNPGYGSCEYPTLRNITANSTSISSSQLINPGASSTWLIGGAFLLVHLLMTTKLL